MIVCVCHRVSHKTIEQCARAGAHFDDIRAEHKLGSQCGQCEHTARRIWDSAYGCTEAKSEAVRTNQPTRALIRTTTCGAQSPASALHP
ncbi:MAG: hypothetical protein FJ164_00380 [Gammaproteobacteria bacterium]|nr:hypothetical protein [Gammaproteobacteria bacterium]